MYAMHSLFGVFGAPGWMELVIVGLIVLLLFGSRLPKVMRGLGQGITEFKKGVKGEGEEEEEQPARLKQEDASGTASDRTTQPASDAEQMRSLNEVEQSQTTS